nr:antigen WC1.1-like [Misgurnus anguillicaudatus]
MTITADLSVRLVSDSSRCSGRVEVLHDGQWGTVCGDRWDLTDASVVCREVGCGEAVDAPQYGHFGGGSGQIWLDEVDCSGLESSLKNCKSNGWGDHDCQHNHDAGVICSGDGSSLLAGSHLCSGRVEMYFGGRWGTVCDAVFDDQDAEVVCRELNCGVPVQLLGADTFGKGEEQVWTQEIQCRGDESQINFCPEQSSYKKNCTHDNDVGLICSGYTALRLVNGSDICSGRVERQYFSKWGSVCDECMNMRAANVLCRELNCGIAVSVVGVDWFGEGSGEIWADVIDCQGNETKLSECSISSWSRAESSHKQDVGVICSNSSLSLHDGRVRLSGERECEGEVEVYIHQVWRRVLLDSWSLTESSVVCRQLGCGSVLNFTNSSSSSDEHSYECVMGFQCSGTEDHLRNCSSPQTLNCSATQQLTITCLGQRPIRLVGSGGDCAGRLEVFHKGSWGTVCDDFWDIKDAHVVCRQLQCGVALSNQPVPAWFGPGSGPIWLDDVNCEGNETSLWSCSSRVWGDHDCKHKEDVGVVCSEFKEFRLTEGCEGNVEVFYNGSWGNVCWNQMNRDTASLICQELNCGRSASEPNYSKGLKPHNWLDYFKCRSDDFILWQCPSSSWAPNHCNEDEVANIICSGEMKFYLHPHQRQCSNHLPLRLSGGKGLCSGRLEVYHNSVWGSVCDDLWDIRDAQVVCRQLGCGAALSVDGNEAFGAGEGVVWMNRVECRGTEIHLWDCPHVLKNHTDCSHKEQVRLICADLSVRLVNGGSRCSGNVEVLHDGQWGTVCHYYWDMTDAAVVCREVNCGEALYVTYSAYFGQGSGPITMDLVGCNGSEASLKDCRSEKWNIQYCSHIHDAGVICSETINYGRFARLVDGPHQCSGRVELLRGNTWMSMCDAVFDDQDAEVVCRELNCGVPVQLLGADTFGKGEGQVWTQEIQCRGDESLSRSCSYASRNVTCSHDNDVGLRCSGYSDHRLMNGPDICSGRVERQYFSKWGSVCDECMNMRAANVLCRELNCGIAVSVVGVDWFGEGSGEIWADVFDCQGNETKLSECSISSWSRAESSHKQDVGVICSSSSLSLHDGRVRLSGERECEGEVEVYIHQVWRRVLLDSWSLTESSVVCRQLGCGSVLNFTNSSSSSDEHSYECVMGFQCSGTEDHLRNCSSPQTLNCSTTQQLSITCLGQRSIRLVGSGGDCAGRLEVFHKGSWGTVCDDFWDIKDAHVVCRQLQCGVALSNQPVPAWFGPGSGPIWLDDVNCEGNETSLWSCSSRVWGDHDCKHKEDVGVVCSEFKEFRLTEGCEGNVEVFYNGSWGNVCLNQMNRDTASLICQELNCGRSASELNYSDALRSHNWLDYFNCRSDDSTLWQCPSSPWGLNNCNEDEVTNIICSETVIHEVPRSHLICSASPSPYQRQCSNHLPLRLSGGKGLCSGRLEVYHNSVWGSVCDDLWDIRDAQVVCRQLACGAALSVDGNEAFGAGEGVVWMNRVECRGTEIHLWDCPHVLINHTDCSHNKVRLICADSSVYTTPATTTTTSASPSVSPQTPLFNPPVVVIVLGVLLLLLLVPLLILIQHNREMRRALSKRRHRTQTEAVYEEIDHRHTNTHTHFTQRVDVPDDNYDDVIIIRQNIQDINAIRLLGGSRCSGRVEMPHKNTWMSVCDAVFDDQDAEVVCRELNCGVPVQLLGADTFGKGEEQVWTQEIQCTGEESHISFCLISLSPKDNCTHENAVGLTCSGFSDLRLVNGSDICSGRVERQYFSKWGSVCDECMNMRAANVLCRELNCGIAVSVVQGLDWFGEGSGEIWADVFDCQGNETKLSECSISSWSRAESSHKQDVGVICSNSSLSLHDGRVRLSGERECEGEVEVYIHQVWRRVLLDSWSLTESSVVCRQLGCGSVLNFTNSSSSSDEHSYECVMGFQCSGTEDHLRNCSSPQTLNCSATQQLSITCQSQRSIRLVGSGGDCAGRLEVFHKGSWGTVCDDFWDIKDAHVVCRQLQCGVALSNQPVPAWFGSGSGLIWLDDVNCEGNETSLWSCSSRVWGDHDCNHKEDVGVVCSEFKELRLTEGCEGNVEVFYNGSWGNVCWNQMESDTASLICQELNCGRSGSLSDSTSRVPSAYNWLDNVKCRPHDSNLWQCPTSPWGKNNCGQNEVTYIICSGEKIKITNYLTCFTSPSPYQRKCSNHLPLRLSGGKGLCSGRLEVYHNSVWGSVCDDLWDIRDAQVVCRQLGCGAALSTDENEAFGAGEGVVWMNRVECRGTEIHLWDCPHVLKNHTDCSHKEQVRLICADLSVTTTSATTTSASPSVFHTKRRAVRWTTVTPPQTPPAASLFIPPVVVIVLGVLLLLLLVLLLLLLLSLLILIKNNRVMKRGTEIHTSYTDLFKRRHWAQTEAVYEEIDHRHTNRESQFTQRGSLISEEQHSGYEVADELLSEEEMVKKVSAEYYDDVITDGLKDTLEQYDDVITTGQNSDPHKEGVQEVYDNVKNDGEDVKNVVVYADVLEESV